MLIGMLSADTCTKEWRPAQRIGMTSVGERSKSLLKFAQRTVDEESNLTVFQLPLFFFMF